MAKTVAKFKDLSLNFYTYEGVVRALDDVDLEIREGETLGIVGETGCGKSVTSLTLLSIVNPPGKVEGGHVLFQVEGGTIDILKQRDAYLRKIRGEEISMIFQEPRAALNPVFTVNEQVSEVLFLHRKQELCKNAIKQIDEELNPSTVTGSKNTQTELEPKKRIKKASSIKAPILKIEKRLYKKMIENPYSLSIDVLSSIPLVRRFRRRLETEAKKEVVKLLASLRIPDPDRVAEMYPHELSGGMAQRIVIAMALACRPTLLIADEPTTNLDVTVQAQILELIKELKTDFHSTILYITHDMGVVAEVCDRVAVMYAGNVVETAEVFEIFKNPLHPYTIGLLHSIPRPGKDFVSIEGTVPSLIDPPVGCRFNPRCRYAKDVCLGVKPKLVEVAPNHFVHCHLYPQKGAEE